MEKSVIATQHAVDEAGIRYQFDKFVEAIRAMDLEGVASLFAPDILSFDVNPPLQHVGAQAKRENWAEVFTAFQPPLDYEIRGLTIALDGDVAFGYSLNRLRGTLKNGTSIVLSVRATFCLRKIDGTWLIVHDHISVPIDVETGRAVFSPEP